MSERNPKIYLLPNLMTAGNLFCGFAAVLCIYDGAQDTDFRLAAVKFHDAIWFILAACIFDLLDGRLARLGGHDSAFGREFDSLADIVSFGMAPALLVYQIVLGEFQNLGWMIAFVTSRAERCASRASIAWPRMAMETPPPTKISPAFRLRRRQA